jgi:glutaconyl-CoA decarboxylase
MKYLVSLKGKDYEVEVERGEAILVSVTDTPAPVAAAPAAAAPVAAPAAAPAAAAPITGGEPVPSPMPGVILKICVSQGQAVKNGDLLAVLEAMKMENEIFAPKDGTIAQIVAKQGAQLDTGDPIVVIG